MALGCSLEASKYWKGLDQIPGAFDDIDFLLFEQFLRHLRPSGDLLEIGAYLGKSAILIGLHAGTDDVVICDLFGSDGAGPGNLAENNYQYHGLTRTAFEENYLKYVDAQPRIIQELSSTISDHVVAGSVSFAHIDGGHSYEVVAADIHNVRGLLMKEGVMVLDDYRAVHTPGVAAAAWAEVSRGLIPICLSEAKMYATWSPTASAAAREHLEGWLAGHPEIHRGHQTIAGHDVLLIMNPTIMTPRRAFKATKQAAKDLIPSTTRVRLGKRLGPYLGE